MTSLKMIRRERERERERESPFPETALYNKGKIEEERMLCTSILCHFIILRLCFYN
jgi:hypothetical protein